MPGLGAPQDPLDEARQIGRLFAGCDLAGASADPTHALGRRLAVLEAAGGALREGIDEALTWSAAQDRREAVRRVVLRTENTARMEARLGWRSASLLASCWLERIAAEDPSTQARMASILEHEQRPVHGERDFLALLARARGNVDPVDAGASAASSVGLPSEVSRDVCRLLDRSNSMLRAHHVPLRAVLVPLEPPAAHHGEAPDGRPLPTAGAGPESREPRFWPFRIGGTPKTDSPATSETDSKRSAGPADRTRARPSHVESIEPAAGGWALRRFREVLERLLPTLPPPLWRHLLAPA